MNESGLETWTHVHAVVSPFDSIFWFAYLSFKRTRKTTRAMCMPAWWQCIWRHKPAQRPSEWGWLLRRLFLLKRPFLSTSLPLKTLAICGVEQDSRRTLKCLHCFSFWNDSHKVNRCLARYSPHATTTSQPTKKAPNEPNMHILGQIWPFLRPKNLIITGGSKSFGTHVTEKTPKHLVRVVFWSAMGPYFGWFKKGARCASSAWPHHEGLLSPPPQIVMNAPRGGIRRPSCWVVVGSLKYIVPK